MEHLIDELKQDFFEGKLHKLVQRPCPKCGETGTLLHSMTKEMAHPAPDGRHRAIISIRCGGTCSADLVRQDTLAPYWSENVDDWYHFSRLLDEGHIPHVGNVLALYFDLLLRVDETEKTVCLRLMEEITEDLKTHGLHVHKAVAHTADHSATGGCKAEHDQEIGFVLRPGGKKGLHVTCLLDFKQSVGFFAGAFKGVRPEADTLHAVRKQVYIFLMAQHGVTNLVLLDKVVGEEMLEKSKKVTE